MKAEISDAIRMENSSDGETYITIRGVYYNNCWILYFGEIQSELLTKKYKKIIVDLSKCLFISPTPMLSLLLTLYRCKMDNKSKIEFKLSEDINDDKSSRFWHFCEDNGFYEIMRELSDKNLIDLNNNTRLNDHANYEKIVDARIINMNDIAEVDNVVSKILNEINEEKLKISKENRTHILVTIRNILTELLDNVKKHAYVEKEENKPCALYIRVRKSNEDTIQDGKKNNKYSRETVKPQEIYLENAIEIYFQDLGKGLINSLLEKKVIRKENRPLRSAIQQVFYSTGLRPRNNNTTITGLGFLRELLSDGNNFFSIYDQYEGVGTYATDSQRINTNKIHLLDLKEEASRLRGLIYNFTLFDRKNLSLCNYSEKIDIVWNSYRKKYHDYKFTVIDYRDDIKVDLGRDEIDADWLWIFPGKYATKAGIIKQIRDAISLYPKKKKLIIADIPDEEIVLYQHTLNNTYANLFATKIENEESYTNAVNTIFLVSKQLKCIEINQKDIRYIVIDKDSDKTFEVFNRAIDYLYKMKIYDSRKLAKAIEKTATGKCVITKGIIEWNDKSTLDGYINFDLLVSNTETNKMLERSIERLIPFMRKSRLIAIDSLTKRLVDATNLILDQNDYKEVNEIGVGSVIVSGLTLQSNSCDSENSIHFFSRSYDNAQPSMFFDPVYLYSTKLQEKKYYIREGKSYRIRKKDCCEIKINTNSYINEAAMYHILHEYSYSSVLFGHMNFEERHDLFSMNLDALLYDRDTKLLTFIDDVLRWSIGHYFEKQNADECPEIFQVLQNSSIFVYPYNPFTSSVLSKSKLAQKYTNYIWGMTPVNVIRNGETLEYSDTYKDGIKKVFNEYKEKYSSPRKVIIFDTLSYSGRTRQEIYEFIKSIEETEVVFVNIVDAKVSHYDKPKNEINYFNLNIPLLGVGSVCEICTVLDKLEMFKEKIIDAKILERIDMILNLWQAHDVRNYHDIIELQDFKEINAIDFMKKKRRYYVNPNITFKNALPLYLYITNRIKIENDFSILEDVLDYEKQIDNTSQAFLCAVFILEYRENIYPSLLYRICSLLLDTLLMPDRGEKERIGQLGLLALLNIRSNNLWKIVKRYLEQLDDKTRVLSASCEGNILFLYFIENIKKENVFSESEIFYILINKCKSGNVRLDLYKQFHCQLINTSGRVHSSPLKCMVEDTISDKKTKLYSLELIKQSLNNPELRFDIMYEERSGKDDAWDEIDLIEKCLKLVKEAVRMIEDEKDTSTETREKIELLYQMCIKCHQHLFLPIFLKQTSENKDKSTVFNKIDELLQEYNTNHPDREIAYDESYSMPQFPNEKDVEAIYYIWNNMLSREIYYILDNVAKNVNDKEMITVDGDDVAGQVRISISETELLISIYNNSETAVETIRSRSKQRYQKEVLNLLGIEIDYKYNSNEGVMDNEFFNANAIVAQIRIPNIYKYER